MDNIHEIASDGAEMPRFDDGMVNLSELLRIMAESLVNEIVDARADEACEAGNQRNGYRERLQGHRRRARGQDHRARRGRQPRCRREGGVTCARTTAFQVILGSSGSLRPPSRTEPYINIRDTTLKTGDYLLSFIRRPKIHARASGFPRSGSASRGIADFDWG